MGTFETSGSVHFGQRKASGSFVRLRADPTDLSITTPVGSISFSPREVIELRRLRGLFGYGGFRIVHTRDRRDVQFWCRDADAVRANIVAAGFVPCGRPGGGPDPARRLQHEAEDSASAGRTLKFVLLLLGFFCVLFAPIIVWAIHSSYHNEPLDRSWATVQADPRVTTITGSPIAKTASTGSYKENGASGVAGLHYDVTGPGGRGTVDLDATKADGSWHVDRLVFRPDGRDQAIELANDRDASASPGR